MAQTSAYGSQQDFFGGGATPITSNVLAPEKTLEQIAAEEEAKRRRAEELRLASVPYGTPISQGGTADTWEVTTKQRDTSGVNGDLFAELGDSTTARLLDPYNGTYAGRTSVQNAMGSGGSADAALRSPATFEGGSVPAAVTPQYTGNATGQAGAAPGAVGAGNGMAEGLADQVLGTEPTVAPQNAVTKQNMQNLTPVIDPALAQSSETDRALAMSQDLVDRVLNTPLQTKILADQALSNQLLIARSARGGAGAVQSASDTAIQQAPALLGTASQASIQEQVTRAGAAGQAASIYAGVAGSAADRAVKIAEANQGAGLQVLGNLTALTGLDYSFDTAKMQSIGQLARDFFQNQQVYAGLSLQQQRAVWDDATKRYGIDRNFKAAVEKIAADEGIGELEMWKMILGGVQGAGTLAAGA